MAFTTGLFGKPSEVLLAELAFTEALIELFESEVRLASFSTKGLLRSFGCFFDEHNFVTVSESEYLFLFPPTISGTDAGCE